MRIRIKYRGMAPIEEECEWVEEIRDSSPPVPLPENEKATILDERTFFSPADVEDIKAFEAKMAEINAIIAEHGADVYERAYHIAKNSELKSKEEEEMDDKIERWEQAGIL